MQEAFSSAADDFENEKSDVVMTECDVSIANLCLPQPQELLDQKLHCRCCSLRRRIESNSRLCPVYWADCFSEVPITHVHGAAS